MDPAGSNRRSDALIPPESSTGPLLPPTGCVYSEECASIPELLVTNDCPTDYPYSNLLSISKMFDNSANYRAAGWNYDTSDSRIGDEIANDSAGTATCNDFGTACINQCTPAVAEQCALGICTPAIPEHCVNQCTPDTGVARYRYMVQQQLPFESLAGIVMLRVDAGTIAATQPTQTSLLSTTKKPPNST